MSSVNVIQCCFFKKILLFVLLLFAFVAQGQEICNNGIDDNGNGLIDLNDTAACACVKQPPSLIPNSSFELKNCCPSTFSQMSCSQGWIQASNATSDYMNSCGMIFPAALGAHLFPPPDGNGMAGFISSLGWQEYIGSCLTTPMNAGTPYSLQFSIASTPVNGQGQVCNNGVITYVPTYIMIYGSQSCGNLPFSGLGCPPAAQWVKLDSVLYTPVASWGTITFNFTPAANVNAIIIGSPCNLPPSYSPATCSPYFYVDNLFLNETQLINNITQSGSWCSQTNQLTGTSVPGATYQWYREGVALVGETGLTLDISGNNLPIGNYSLTTTLGGDCSYTTVSVIQFNNPPAIASAGPFCTYELEAYLTANMPGGTWGGTGITDPVNGVFNISIAGAGTHLIHYSLPPSGGCPRSDTIAIVVNPPPVSFAGPDTTICSEEVISVGGPSTAGYTYSWNPATGLSNPLISNPTLTLTNNNSAPVTANYSLITTNTTTNCQSLDQLVVTVLPVPKIIPTGPFCKTDPGGMLTASISGGTWSGTGIINPGFGTFSPAVANLGNNLITYTVSGACGGGDTAIIVVTAPPSANAGTNITMCAGVSGTIGAASTPGYTYSWQPVADLTSATVSNPGVLGTNTGTTPVTTSYILTTTHAGCNAYDTVNVTVNPQPSLIIANAPAVCTPSTADLTVPAVTAGSTGGGVLTYWLNASATTALANPSAVSAAGTYYIKATATGGCSDTVPVTVIVSSATVSNAGTDITLCTADSGQIGAASTPGKTYSWSPATGLSNASIANPSIALVNTGTAPQTIAYVVTTTSGGSCASKDTVNVTVNPVASVDAGPNQTICSGTDVALNGLISGVVGGTWSGGSGAFSPSATTLNAQYTPSASEITAGNFTLILTSDDPPGSCVAVADTVTFTVMPGATVDAGLDDTICEGNTVSLNASFGGTATNGTWSGGAGTYSLGNTAVNSVYTPTVAETEAGTVTLVFTTDDPVGFCPAATDTVVIDINLAPVANAGTSFTVCGGSSINLSGIISGSATTASWSGGTGTFSPDNTALNPTYIPGPGEQYADSIVLTLSTNNPSGFPCAAASDDITIYVYNMPLVNFSVDDSSGCPEHCVNFFDLMAGSGVIIASRIWDFGDGSPVSNAAAPSHCYPQTGTYDVTLTVTSENSCSGTLTIPQLIEVFPMPTAEFNYTPQEATISSSLITLHNLSSQDVNYWFWDFGDGDSLTSYVPDTTHHYPADSGGTYYTTLIVQNINGCADTTMHPVVIYPEFSFYIPNAFTPNNDGINDLFLGKGVGIQTYELMIFDRWGNLVFYTDDLNKGWDGKVLNGPEVVQQDTYAWKVKLTDVFRKKYNYIGIVSIIKGS